MYRESPQELALKSLRLAINLLLIAVLVFTIYYFVVMYAAPAPEKLDPQGLEPTVLDKLGPRGALSAIMVMVGLVAWLFWLFVHFGRRLSERGYLGQLTADALAHAEIARIEDALREDLRKGVYAHQINVDDEMFRQRYKINKNDPAPELYPGVTLDESGYIMRSAVELEYPRLGISPGDDDFSGLLTDPEMRKLDQQRKQAFEKAEAFRKAYRDEQLRLYREHLVKERNAARSRAAALLPDIDVSSFGGGWIFVLEFTTIIFIVFTILSLGFVGILGAEHIATILASVAGYVLGKSSNFRGPGGQEIVRGSEQPTALLEALTKPDQERIKLQEQVQSLQNQLGITKVMVPLVLNKPENEASSTVEKKELLPEIKRMVKADVVDGVVFDQYPDGGTEVEKQSAVILFVAQNPPSTGGGPEPVEGLEPVEEPAKEEVRGAEGTQVEDEEESED